MARQSRPHRDARGSPRRHRRRLPPPTRRAACSQAANRSHDRRRLRGQGFLTISTPPERSGRAALQRSGRGSGGPQQRLACMLRWWVWGAGQARPWRPAAWSNISLDAPFIRGWASPNQSTASREKREVSWRGNSTSRRWRRDPARGPCLPTCLMGFRSAPQSCSLKEGRDR